MKGETSMKTCSLKYITVGTLLIVLLSSVLASCAQPQPNPPKEVAIYQSEIDQSVGLEVGDILEVALQANPSTGYIWEVGFYNQSVLRPYGEPEFSTTGTDPGAEELQKLHLEAIGAGETNLVLVTRRPFEKGAVNQQTFQVYVVVE
jgi:predicted secreted protein